MNQQENSLIKVLEIGQRDLDITKVRNSIKPRQRKPTVVRSDPLLPSVTRKVIITNLTNNRRTWK